MAADLQIPEALRNQIETWVVQFKDNLLHLGDRPVDQPVWSDGFDEVAWLDRGHELAEQLGEHYPEHFVYWCAEKRVVWEIAADQLDYVCALTGLCTREFDWRMPGNEPDPDPTGELRLMPEYGVEWGIWAGWLPYYETPRLRSKSGLARFSLPRSLGLTASPEERLRQWNEDWRRGFVDYITGSGESGTALGLPGYGYGVPLWSDGVNPAFWYGEGLAIAAQLADELPGVKVRLAAVRYVCSPSFLSLASIFDDDEFFTPVETQTRSWPLWRGRVACPGGRAAP